MVYKTRFFIRRAALLLAFALAGSSLSIGEDAAIAKESENTAAATNTGKLALLYHWSLQSSSKIDAKGETISTRAFTPKGWHDATVPTTVVAALVKDKTLPDPFFGTNLREFAGVTYPIGGNFSPSSTMCATTRSTRSRRKAKSTNGTSRCNAMEGGSPRMCGVAT